MQIDLTRAPLRVPYHWPVAALSDVKVALYAQEMAAGAKFPPVRLVRMDDGSFRIVDGHHRVMAARASDSPDILALVMVEADFEQLDLDLRDSGEGKRADDAEFWTYCPTDAQWHDAIGAALLHLETLHRQLREVRPVAPEDKRAAIRAAGKHVETAERAARAALARFAA